MADKKKKTLNKGGGKKRDKVSGGTPSGGTPSGGLQPAQVSGKQASGTKKPGWFGFPSVLAGALTALLVSLLFWLLAGSHAGDRQSPAVDGTTQTQAGEAQEAGQETGEQISRLSAKVDAGLDTLSGRVEKTEGRISTVEGRLGALAAPAKSIAADDPKDDLGATGANSGEFSAFSSEINGRLSGMERQIAGLASMNKKLAQELKTVAAANADLKSQNENLQSQNANLASATGSSPVSGAIGGLNDRIADLKSSFETQLVGIGDRLDGLGSEIGVLQTKGSALADGVRSKAAELASANQALKGETARRIEAANAASINRIAAVRATLNGVNTAVGALSAKLDGLASTQANLVAEQKAATEMAAKAVADAQMKGNRMLGVSRLRDVLESGGGYAGELEFLARNAGDDATLTAITAGIAQSADKGAATVEELRSGFSDLSREFIIAANKKARAQGTANEGRIDKIKSLFSGLIIRVDEKGSTTPPASPGAKTVSPSPGANPSLRAQLGAVQGLIGEDKIRDALEKLAQIELPDSENLAAWVVKARERELLNKAKSTLDSWLGQYSAQ